MSYTAKIEAVTLVVNGERRTIAVREGAELEVGDEAVIAKLFGERPLVAMEVSDIEIDTEPEGPPVLLEWDREVP